MTWRWPAAVRLRFRTRRVTSIRRKASFLLTDTAALSTSEARGTVGGEGAGLVVLKRLVDALADGDTIHAVIKGSAVNNDGALKIGYHRAEHQRPGGSYRRRNRAWPALTPSRSTYVEAHGTGTALGDPIEVAALTQAFHADTQKKSFCAIGSLKSNIGHLDAGSRRRRTYQDRARAQTPATAAEPALPAS